MVGMLVFGTIVSNGEILRSISPLEIAEGIGGSIFAVVLTSFYGGVAGAIVMAIASVIRKTRHRSGHRNNGCSPLTVKESTPYDDTYSRRLDRKARQG